MQITIALNQLEEFADLFWKYVGESKVIAFHGEMGAGKTTLISLLCKSKGVAEGIGSPTFSIINEYVFLNKGREKIIYHIDLYRLNGDEEIINTGVEDCIQSGDYCLVEWPEKAPHLFDENTVHVYIKNVTTHTRLVKIELPNLSVKEQS